MIQIDQLAMAYGDRTLFRQVNLNLAPGHRYGVVGANGSGKTTFLKILAGEITPSEGQVRIASQLQRGILRQDHFEYEQIPILDVVLMGKMALWQALSARRLLSHQTHLNPAEGIRLAELEQTIEQHHGYQAESQAAEILEGLGLQTEQLTTPMATLSGGYKLRVMLAQCLFSQPDVLLLDEPNNHLDIYSIAWLAEYLIRFAGIVVLVSHDHHFISRISTHILDIDYETIRAYKGNYDQFLAAKNLEQQQKEIEIAAQEKKKQELQAFYEHFRAKATKARQAISRKKQLDRLEDIQIIRSSRIAPKFRFGIQRPPGQQVLKVERLYKSYGRLRVLSDISFTVWRQERVAVLGPNGIGKSTLLKILSGQTRSDAGNVTWGYETSVGYFAQNHREIIPDNTTPYDWLYHYATAELTSTIRGLLGRMLFSGDDVLKSTAALSGGEAARLIFAQLMLAKNNVLLLDEPTNHLDLETIDALVGALLEYPGTLIFVSHDRYVVDRIATAIIELRPTGFRYYGGTYTEYLNHAGEDYLNPEPQLKPNLALPKATPLPRNDPRKRRELVKELTRQTRQYEKTESDIQVIEQRIAVINQILAGEEIYLRQNQDQFQRLFTEKERLESDHHQLLESWDRLSDQVNQLQQLIDLIDRDSRPDAAPR